LWVLKLEFGKGKGQGREGEKTTSFFAFPFMVKKKIRGVLDTELKGSF
jgi:hypothetical protein